MEGQLPPCPQCHRAMHDFAQRHGTTINYNYNGETITYSPGSHPTADPDTSPNAARLIGGDGAGAPHYGELDGPLRPEGEGIGGRGPVSGTAGAGTRYGWGGHGAPAAYTDEADRVDPDREIRGPA
jgi:hypothetical protein